MIFVEWALLIVGLVLLIIGYRKTDRNLMLAAAIAMWVSASIHNIVESAIETAATTQEQGASEISEDQ